MLRTMIRWGTTTLARVGGSNGQTPVQQVTYMDKVSDVVPWLPYGFAASVPPEELTVLLSILANSDSTVSLPGSPGKDPEMVKSEVALYHPETGSKVHMRADGSIDIIAGAASIVLTAAGGIILKPGSIPVTIDGDLVVTGDATVTGSTALGAIVTSSAKDISLTHTHLAGSLMDSVPQPVTGITGIPI